YYALLVTPAHGLVVQYRALEGLRTQQPVLAAGAVPAFLQVARAGSTFTAYTSPDGAAWAPLAGAGGALAVAGAMLGGLAVTSHNPGVLGGAVFDGVSVAAGAPPPPNSCPSGWSCGDVGGGTPAGTQGLSGSTWTVQGGGGDIWGTSDQFHFVWQPQPGDGSVTARVASPTNTRPWAKAGVMLRQDATAASAYYAVEMTPSNGIVVQDRASSGVSATWPAGVSTGTAPAYLRATRSGTTFSAFTSSDGVTWTAVPGSTATLSVSGGMLAGLAGASPNTGGGGPARVAPPAAPGGPRARPCRGRGGAPPPGPAA